MKNTRAFSMPMVITVLGILSAGLGVLLVAINTSSSNAASMIGRRQTFYACDGIARGVISLSHNYLSGTASPNSAGLRTAVCTLSGPDDCSTGILPNLTPPGFTIESFTTTLIGARQPGTVPSGPFTGMTASLDNFSVAITARKNSTGDRCNISQVVSSADISLFQFFAWADGFLDIYPAPPMVVTGRTHVNGDFCAAEQSSLALDRLTASGNIFSGGTCSHYRRRSGQFSVGAFGGSGSAGTAQVVDSSHDSSLANATWVPMVTSRWGGNLGDGDSGVTALKFPIVGQPQVQDGLIAPALSVANVANNANSIRFLIDPPAASDDDSIRAQRYACKADIRIINGVWYKRSSDEATCTWPGTPIWSDHPGKYATSATTENNIMTTIQNVGQEDLGTSWGAGIPRLYSYYEYDPADKGLFDTLAGDVGGVISYGSLIRTGSPTATPATSAWRPGFWMSPTQAGATSGVTISTRLLSTTDGYGAADINTNVSATFDNLKFCPFKSATGTNWVAGDMATAPGIMDATATNCFTSPDVAPVGGDGIADGGAATQIDKGSVLLAATRSGFRDIRASKSNHDDQDEVLPINFDVAAFAAAMGSTRANELGTHFSQGAGFNGIVYISATWPNSNAGMGNAGNTGGTLATLSPRSGADRVRDVNQVAIPYVRGEERAHRALPYPLCSTQVGAVIPPTASSTARAPYGSSNQAVPGDGLTSPFSVPPCSANTDVNTSRPNALRIINARDFTPGTAGVYQFNSTLGKGLSVVTNLPAYVLGDFNSTSVTACVDDVGCTDTADWVPGMIGGDALTYLSNNWQDSSAPWAANTTQPTSLSSASARQAVETTYVMAGISGDVQTNGASGCSESMPTLTTSGNACWSGGLNNFPRFMEGWSGDAGGAAPQTRCRIVGSFVIGFRSVYARQPWMIGGANDLYFPPDRQWHFDTNFNTPTNQPPGAPSFSIDAIRTWRRQ